MIDFTLSSEQEQFVKTARDFGREVLGPAEAKLDKMADPDEAFASDLFWSTLQHAFDLGFHKMGLPESYGGLGLDAITAGLVWEELARWGAGFSASLMAGAVVPRLIAFMAPHNEALVNEYVIPYCEKDDARLITAWGSSEPDIGSDGKNYADKSVRHRTTARLRDGRWVIDGTKSNFISNGGIANAYIVFACVEPEQGICGSGAFVVPASAKGVTRGKAVDRLGLRVLNQAAVYFDDVEVDESNLIFPPGDGYPMLHNAIITVGNLGTGYLALGTLRAAYEEALSYARERVQWGKPIAEHQLVAKKLFEANTAIESMRAFLWKGSWLCATAFPGDLRTSLSAKINATNLAAKHTADMAQILGGYGLTRDYPVEKYVRDAPLLQVMDGTNDTLMVKAAALL